MAESAAWQVIEDRVVMFELGNGRYYRLDAVGSRMWELIVELGDLDAVHARLLLEYEVDGAQLRDDLEEFVAHLSAAGLMHVEPPAQ